MIRTIITPAQSNYSFTLEFPENYLGKEVEVIAFLKEEGLIQENPKKSMADFWGILSDETAAEMRKEIADNRNDWENRLKQQY